MEMTKWKKSKNTVKNRACEYACVCVCVGGL